MQRPILSIPELAKMFNVSEERIKQQYANTAQVIKKQLDKSLQTGKRSMGIPLKNLRPIMNFL